jgi:hypothetical protein
MLGILPIVYIWWILLTIPCPQLLPSCEVADEKVKQAMKYHGVSFATCVSNGQREVWTFQRNGQTCSLFTKAFEESCEKKGDF